MRVKLEWLNELVDISNLSTKEIVDTLSLYSTEVESVERVVEGTNLKVGHVLTCVNHPDSDHLHICTVDVGNEVLQIVCGAPNIKAGLNVIVALVNAELPGGFKIKKSKIRGVESFGMICSLSELGMENKYIEEEYSDGIYYFKDDVTPGSDPLKLLNFNDDILELGLTPNRADMLSMIGVAYEAGAVFNKPFSIPSCKYTEDKELNSDNVSVKIETNDCLCYHAKTIKDIKIKKSPNWLSSRLIAFGIRPINNAVDITNYILALFGQPLHAFDAQKVGKDILVRKANENEEMITLDGIKRVLQPSDIVITDGVKPIALAGVMGGKETGIDENTKDIILEAAVFDPISIRKTYKRLDLRSEASIRYEKGVDLGITKLALDYACYLYQTLCDARITNGDVFEGKTETEKAEILITEDYITNYLGVDISVKEIKDICQRLQFQVEETKDGLLVTIPTRRQDVKIKADMVEEIGRIHGYATLPVTLPASQKAGYLTEYQKERREIRHLLSTIGLTEAVNYSLREKNDSFKYLFKDNAKDISLIFPISNERKILRRNIIPSLLENVKYVQNRKIKNVAFYEIGKVYYEEEEKTEEEHLGIAMTGVLSQTNWQGKTEEIDFFTIKGIVNQVFKLIGISPDYVKYENTDSDMHPLRTAKIICHDEVIGYIGQIHPKYAQDNDLSNVYVSEINLSKVLKKDKEPKVYIPVSKVPSVERDLAIVLKKDIPASDIVKTVLSVDKKLISDCIIFDVYVGDKIGEDEKSIAIKIVFSANETLTDDVINSKINKILKNIEKNHGGILRS